MNINSKVTKILQSTQKLMKGNYKIILKMQELVLQKGIQD